MVVIAAHVNESTPINKIAFDGDSDITFPPATTTTTMTTSIATTTTKLTKYRKTSMMLASFLLVVSAAMQFGLVTIENFGNNGSFTSSSSSSEKKPIKESSYMLFAGYNLVPTMMNTNQQQKQEEKELSNHAKTNDDFPSTKPSQIVIEEIKMTFEEFKNKFRKLYATDEEDNKRKEIFEKNVHKINHHNLKSELGKKFQMGINEYTDMTGDETPKGLNKIHKYRYYAKQKQRKEGTADDSSSSSHHDFFTTILGGGDGTKESGDNKEGATTYATASLLTESGVVDPDSFVDGSFRRHRKLLRSTADDGDSRRNKYRSVGSTLPKHVDWRKVQTKHGSPVTTPVKNQRMCGSCWAFAAAEVLETHIALNTDVLFSISPQQFVDCAPNPDNCGGTGGCDGSTSELAFDFASKHGIVDEWTYGYTSSRGKDGKCGLHTINRYNPSELLTSAGTNTTDLNDESGYLEKAVASIAGFSALPTNSYDSLMWTVATMGSVVISVAANTWYTYSSGVFDDSTLTDHFDLNHAVVLEGYGTDEETGEDYWLVRNSWGPQWGENGYIRLKRVDPATVDNPTESMCKSDITPLHGIACAGPDLDLTPPEELPCGTSGILYDTSVPIAPHLLYLE